MRAALLCETRPVEPSPPPSSPAPPAGDPDREDRALLLAIAGGDRRALEQLYRRHAGWLTVRLQRRCHEVELVDSALQDTFLAVWRQPGSFAGRGEVGAWLWGIALRRLIDQQRRRKPTPMRDGAFESAAAAAGVATPQPSAEAEALDASWVGGDMADAMRVLAPELQRVLLATAVDGLTTAEAATMLGIPHGTVKTRLMRARAILQEHMR